MAKNNKYQINLLQTESTWQAQILRQITSKKTKITKQQADFTSESEAEKWAETELKKLIETQVQNNQRHNQSRKEKAQIAQQRSSKRAEKISKAERAKIENETDERQYGIDPEVDYNFDEN